MVFQRFLLKNVGTGLIRRLQDAILKRTKASSRSFTSPSNGSPPSRPTGGPLSRYALLYRSKRVPKGSGARRTGAVLGTSNVGSEALVAGGPYAEKMVGIWLFSCAGWVFSFLVIGGITRLMRLRLSMTDWKLTGILPPRTDEQWRAEFEKYQQSPEYKRVNKGMSIERFKLMYWMEYGYMMWGRTFGILIIFPSAYFAANAVITRQLAIRLSGLFAIGAGQGLVGWWMAKSGLEEPTSEYVQPRVSPYRLAAHLTSSFAMYCGLLWTAFSVIKPHPPIGSINYIQGAAKVRQLAIPVSVIVGITAMSGAFVAGNDAGHACNTFPKMGDAWIPDNIFCMKPLISNFFENASTVQFNHRLLAMTTLVSVVGLWFATRKLDVNPAVKSLIRSILGTTAFQVMVGISTLQADVPIHLASAHQSGALTLFSLMVLLLHVVRKPSPALLKSLASAEKAAPTVKTKTKRLSKLTW